MSRKRSRYTPEERKAWKASRPPTVTSTSNRSAGTIVTQPTPHSVQSKSLGCDARTRESIPNHRPKDATDLYFDKREQVKTLRKEYETNHEQWDHEHRKTALARIRELAEWIEMKDFERKTIDFPLERPWTCSSGLNLTDFPADARRSIKAASIQEAAYFDFLFSLRATEELYYSDYQALSDARRRELYALIENKRKVVDKYRDVALTVLQKIKVEREQFVEAESRRLFFQTNRLELGNYVEVPLPVPPALEVNAQPTTPAPIPNKQSVFVDGVLSLVGLAFIVAAGYGLYLAGKWLFF